MVRLAVSSPDSPPLNSGSTQVIAPVNNNNNTASAANNSYAHQTDAVAQPSTTTPPLQASVSPTQQNNNQMAQSIPLNQMSPHHMPPFHHHPHSSGANGAHIHDHNNGHHHNGLYLQPYANEFYPAGADGAPPHGAYFIPPELCPAHTQLCTVHPEYGKQTANRFTPISRPTSLTRNHKSWTNSFVLNGLEHHLTPRAFCAQLFR